MAQASFLLILISSSVLAQGFQTLDRVDGWLIERKLGEQQNPICRASVPGGGSWFSARVHLNAKDELVTPQGLNPPNQQSLDGVKEALKAFVAALAFSICRNPDCL